MAFNPENSRDLTRLRRAVDHSRKKLEPFRKNRIYAHAQRVGKHYGPNTEDTGINRVPVNLIDMMLSIFVSHLAAQNPSVLVTSEFGELKPSANTFQIRMNRLLSEIRYVDTMRDVLTDAMVCLGIVRVGAVASDPLKATTNFTYQSEAVYADSVSLDDWVMDMSAHRYEEVEFAGNRYRVALDEVRDSGLYDSDVVEKLSPTPLFAQQGQNESDRDKSLELGDEEAIGSEYKDHVELYDLWLPKDNLIVTMPFVGADEALRVVPADGPESGPYRLLSFTRVAGNLMPLSPVMAGMDLHLFTNAIYRKIFRQEERRKEVPWFTGEAAQDMQRMIEAADGFAVRVDNPGQTGVQKHGGASPQAIGLGISSRQLFSSMLGSLELLGGLSPQAKTLGQEELLSSNANKRVADMQSRFVNFNKQVVEMLAWYEWTEPLREDVITKRVGSTEFQELWSIETREGDFVQYDIDIQPYSTQEHSPATRLQTLMQIWERVIMPSRQDMQLRGIGLDIGKFLSIISEYAPGGLPELNDILVNLSDKERAAVRSASEQPERSPVTSRTNTRISQSSGPDVEQEMLANMMKAAPQGAEG